MKYVIGIVFAVLALVGFSAMSSYNGFVSLQEGVDAEWSNVETQYQRRYDLIPNLVATVQGAADFEKETLTAVTEARASAFSAMQAVGNGTGSIADFQQSNVVLGRAMNGLLGYSERYPEIQATQNFQISRPNLRERKIGFRLRGRGSMRRFRATTEKFGAFQAFFGQACLALIKESISNLSRSQKRHHL